MHHSKYDVIIIGGSFSGLSAAMALGRSMRSVLVIDSGRPCNRQTPATHNVITLDGEKPGNIILAAKKQVLLYDTVFLINDEAKSARQEGPDFVVTTASGQSQKARKLIITSGIKDIMPDIEGFTECWGISILHCPYCHGYEVINKKTGILSIDEMAFDFTKMISHWTKHLTLFTNGKSPLSEKQKEVLKDRNIKVVESELLSIHHEDGYVKTVNFKDDSTLSLEALYTRLPFEQNSGIPEALGCKINDDGYIEIDEFQRTSISGLYAAGDNTTPFRSVSAAMASGNMAGAFVNKELIEEDF
ncbi:MAG: NAD(P)/FAD-dependent oxidoreductase [Cyclobacteriaceae bacterium]|nr:NAD(P)/FAD-dependent oxidoreductase [Cyclobacteriaceae bacterium]